jgi:hypothetical protein
MIDLEGFHPISQKMEDESVCGYREAQEREIAYSPVEDSPVVNPACPLALNILTKSWTDFGPSEVEAGESKGGVFTRVHYIPELIECLGPPVLQVGLCLAFEGFEDVKEAPVMMQWCIGESKNVRNSICNCKGAVGHD